MMVPAGLVVGHAIAPRATGCLGSDAALSGPLVVGVLACLAGPLAAAAIVAAVRDGRRGRTTSGVTPFVVQQAAAFVAIEGVGLAVTGASVGELVRTSGFWVALAIHASIGAATWLTLRVAAQAGRALPVGHRNVIVGRRAVAPVARARYDLVQVVTAAGRSVRGPPRARPASPAV